MLYRLKPITRLLSYGQAIRSFSTRQKDWVEVSLPVPWGEIRGKWWGPMNVRPIVALHGWQDNSGSFDRLIPLLNKDISFLAVDLPGHGYSSWLPPGGCSDFTTYFLTLKYIKRHLNWPKITLMGHSLGGITCYSYTVLFPEEVDFLMCFDAMKPILPPSDTRTRSIKKIESIIKQTDNAFAKEESPSYTLEQITERLLAVSDGLAPTSVQYLLERNIAPSKLYPGRYYFLRDPRLKNYEYTHLTQSEIVAQAEKVKCPIFYMKANGSSYFEPKEKFYEVVDVLKRNITDFELHYVDGTHYTHLNNPDNGLARFLSNFIQKHNVISDRSQDGLKEDCIVTDFESRNKSNLVRL